MFALKFLKKDKFENYDDYIQNGAPQVPDNFNFAYDVIDELAVSEPDKVALLWTDDSGEKNHLLFMICRACQMRWLTFYHHVGWCVVIRCYCLCGVVGNIGF